MQPASHNSVAVRHDAPSFHTDTYTYECYYYFIDNIIKCNIT